MAEPRITFITRHYPPNLNINGESVWDMARYLRDHFGIESRIICIDARFQWGGQQREPVGHVTRVKQLMQRNGTVGRLAGLLYDGLVLAWKARSYRNTLVICTTSPPLLPFWFSFFFGAADRWGIWAFDLFPESFAAAGQANPQHLIYRWIINRTYKTQPSFLIALGPGQAEHLQYRFNRPLPSIILPCGILFYQEKSEEHPVWRTREDLIYLGYCGNLGEQHNADFIKAAVDCINPEKHVLVLALKGTKSAEVVDYALGKPGVIMVDSVPRNQLHFIDVHLVSLLKSWTHLAVPSKAVSAIAANSAILFCGAPECDNWRLLQNAGWFIEESEDLHKQFRAFLEALTTENLQQRKMATGPLYEDLKRMVLAAYEEVAGLADTSKQTDVKPFL